jgi:hypothetical protein
MGLVHSAAQLYDYAAVFTAADLFQPVPGLESFGHTAVSGDPHIGSLWPFLLGLPLGGLGGYFYRGWRDEHPGKWFPSIAGDYNVGGPWLDIEPYAAGPYVGGPWLDIEPYAAGPYVGGPWLDIEPYDTNPYVGCSWDGGGPGVDLAQYAGAPPVGGPWTDIAGNPHVGGSWVDLVGAARQTWQQTRALIELAKREVIQAQRTVPAVAWVWSLSPPGRALVPGVELEATTLLVPFSSMEQAQAYMFEQTRVPNIGIALFDTTARQHWPNPVRWTQSDDPTYEPLIVQRLSSSVQAAGNYVGADPRVPSMGAALSDVRTRAQSLANKRAGNVVGVIHTTKDNLWHAVAFHDPDDADDWLDTVTQDQGSYTYGAYYDRNDATWPYPVIEKIGGFRPPKTSGPLVGAALDDTRVYAKELATSKRGNAAGVIRSVDGIWSTFAFPNLDAAIDWLTSLTAHRASFVYAGAFEKGSDGTAYVQQEEFGVQPVPPFTRAIAATSGGYTWGAA